MKNKSATGTGTTCAETQREAFSKKQQNLLVELKRAEANVISLFGQTLDAVDNLARIRLKCKLSNSRVAGVYRELKELEKVMSVCKQPD